MVNLHLRLPRVRTLGLLLLLPNAWACAGELPGAPTVAGAEAGFALSLDGSRVAFGAPGENTGAGAAYISDCPSLPCAPATRVAPAWLKSRDLYGSAVAVSGDTLAVGAPGDREGAVYLFVLSGGVWVQQAKLRAFDGRNGDEFGNAIALQGDRIVVGASGADDDRGVVYVFARSGTAWSLDERIQPAGQNPLERFGHGVALSGDTLAAGSPWRSGAAATDWARGSVWIYVRGTSWTQQARLQPNLPANGAQFGFSVDLRLDRLLVGAPGSDGFRGSVSVFERAGTSWAQTAQLVSPDSASGHGFGWSVTLDGNTLMTGAPFSAQADAACGRLHAFVLQGGSWSETIAMPALLGIARETAGYAIVRRGGRVAVGRPGRDRNGVLLTGAVDWFDPLIQTFDDGYEASEPTCQPTPP